MRFEAIFTIIVLLTMLVPSLVITIDHFLTTRRDNDS